MNKIQLLYRCVLVMVLWFSLLPAMPQASGVVTNCSNDSQLSGLLTSSGTITFNCGGTGASATIIISSTKTITNAMTITIDGGGKVTLSGGGVRRMFIVNPGGSLTLNNLTLTNGVDFGGGAVLNDGTLVINNSTLTSNTASGQFGGAIKNTGSVTLTDSVVSNNTATSGYGGGIDSAETNSLVTVTRTHFTNNHAALAGGAIANNGIVNINQGVFSGNTAGADYGGGAIENTGPLTITSSTFITNTAGKGGGVYNESGTATITNSTFSANSVNQTPRTGGAVYNQAGSGPGTLTIIASTFSGNTAPSGTGGSLSNQSGSTLKIRMSILAGGTPANCAGSIQSLGNNLETGTNCAFQAAGDLSNTQPMLGALANNGGFSQTFSLLAGSPVIDGVAANQCIDASANALGSDQRGLTRPVDGNGDGLARCDMGSYELQAGGPPPPTSTSTPTRTPTATTVVGLTNTPTRTATPQFTPTRTPTATAVVGLTNTPTRTATPSPTPKSKPTHRPPDCKSKKCNFFPVITIH